MDQAQTETADLTLGKRNLQTLQELPNVPEFSFLTTRGWRNLVENAKPRYSASGTVIGGNGLIEAGAIIRLGRKILIDTDRLREWLHHQRQQH